MSKRADPLTYGNANEITAMAQRTTSEETAKARSSMVGRNNAQGISKAVLWHARNSVPNKKN
jgi:hypothetical protein